MKSGLFIVFVFAVTAQIIAQDVFNYAEANVLYEQRNYSQAITSYEKILQEQGSSPEIFYNLGNAYYKNGQIGKAILYYERCLQLQPRNADAKYNLSLANMRIKDQEEPVAEFFIKTWWNNCINLLTEKGWAYRTIMFAWLACAGCILYIFAKQLLMRKTGFYAGLLCLLCFAFSLIATLSKAAYDKNINYAVITAPSAIVKSGPLESESNLTIIHEGLKVQLLDYDKDWAEIKLMSGIVGWVKVQAFTEI